MSKQPWPKAVGVSHSANDTKDVVFQQRGELATASTCHPSIKTSEHRTVHTDQPSCQGSALLDNCVDSAGLAFEGGVKRARNDPGVLPPGVHGVAESSLGVGKLR